ncbi:hypothetical protein ACH5RR_017413 [Cinchona calisaya]|uniref:Myb-like domain-containing protein n=1 Tax=Cinchona calisaya TaxID=153742 RepID=A0ABD2ZJA9_9GENT
MEVSADGDRPKPSYDFTHIHYPKHEFPHQPTNDITFHYPTADIHSPEISQQLFQAARYLMDFSNFNGAMQGPLSDRNGGGGSSAVLPAVVPFLTGLEDQCRNVISQTHVFYSAFSQSSGDDCESFEVNKVPLNRKKKRLTIRKLKLFLQNIMNEVMQKLDQMHKELLEMVMKKEQEKIILEEAWKLQEIERARRDEEERALETSRNLALISFIQNVMANQQFGTINSSKPSYQENRGTEIHYQCGVKHDPSSRRWQKAEVEALITARMTLEHRFLVTGAKGSAWDEVAARLAIMGYNRTPGKCKQKWENINKYYRKMGDIKKKCPRSCSYFHELDMLYKR